MRGHRLGLLVGAAVAFLLGSLATQEVRAQNRLAENRQAAEGRMLSALLTQSLEQDRALAKEAAALKAQVAAPVPPASALEGRLSAVKALAGMTPLSGSGVEVVIHDAASPTIAGEPADFQLVHDQYVLHTVGVLLAAGARGIAINGQRYVSQSAIFCSGPTIRINGIPESSPYVITAVGPPGPMLAALKADPDIEGWNEFVPFQFRQLKRVTLPAYRGPVARSLVTPAGV